MDPSLLYHSQRQPSCISLYHLPTCSLPGRLLAAQLCNSGLRCEAARHTTCTSGVARLQETHAVIEGRYDALSYVGAVCGTGREQLFLSVN
jgi:hypothetical protein